MWYIQLALQRKKLLTTKLEHDTRHMKVTDTHNLQWTQITSVYITSLRKQRLFLPRHRTDVDGQLHVSWRLVCAQWWYGQDGEKKDLGPMQSVSFLTEPPSFCKLKMKCGVIKSQTSSALLCGCLPGRFIPASWFTWYQCRTDLWRSVGEERGTAGGRSCSWRQPSLT